MKALILSCNTGQGHNTAGRAMLETLTDRGIYAEMHDALAFGGQTASSVVSGGYVKITQTSPNLFGTLYRAGSFISNPHIKSPVYFANALYAGKLEAFIKENGFDTILCPHLFPAETLTHLRKRGLHVQCYGIATDYTCTPFWEETDIDVFFIPHQALRDDYIKKGFSPERLVVTGIPVSKAFRAKVSREDARKALGLDRDRTMYLLMSGSMGFGGVADIAAELLKLSDSNVRVLVMTGHNERLTALLKSRFGDDERVVPVAYTKEVALYMDACDVTLTKPGGLTSTEAAVKNVPMVHTAPIPGCETVNSRFFGTLGISLPTGTARESATAAVLLQNDAELRDKQLQNQRAQINERAADDIVDFLLNR